MRRLLVPLCGVFAVIAILLLGIHFYRYRFVRQNSDLVKLMPPMDLSLVYADLSLLRRTQLLGLLSNIKVAPDQQYADFIRETGFDYTRDLDAVVIGTDGSQTFLVGRGRFDWDQLQGFAISHQGVCGEAGCRVPGTTPGRWVNLIRVQPDVLGVAVSTSPTAADNLRPPGRRVQEEVPNAAVWAKLSHAMLTNPVLLPLPIQIFAISLQGSAGVTISAMPDRLELRAVFANGAAADTAKQQLQIQTRSLTTALQRGGDKAEADSIGGLLMGGIFWVSGDAVRGTWPIRPELLRALQ